MSTPTTDPAEEQLRRCLMNVGLALGLIAGYCMPREPLWFWVSLSFVVIRAVWHFARLVEARVRAGATP